MTVKQTTINPLPGPQQRFLSTGVREVGYGGQAGGGKSFALILDAVHQLGLPGYNGILFRRTYKQLNEADGLIDLSRQVYPTLGGVYNKSTYTWTFPEYHNNTVRLSHLQHEKDVEGFSGSQYAYIGFDELQNFTERQYLFLFSRNRSSNPNIYPLIRSTFNPGGIGHYWIKQRFIETNITNNIRWFLRKAGKDTEVAPGTKFASARMFIPAKLEDNPYLYRDGQGDYENALAQLDDVDYRRLRLGDWDIKREGRVYHQFSDDNVVSPESVDLAKCEYYVGIDFGAVNEAVSILAYDGTTYYLCYEGVLPPGTTSSRAREILSWLGNRELVGAYGGAPSEHQQRYDYADNDLWVDPPPIGDVESQIRSVNDMLASGELKIFNTMEKTIAMLDNCVRDDREGIAQKSIWHYLDALRYVVSGITRDVEITRIG